MPRILLVFIIITFCTNLYSQESFHEDDKEGLRNILRQKSSVTNVSNLECIGLVAADTANWMISEDWIVKIQNTISPVYIDWEWTIYAPSRLTRLEVKNFTEITDESTPLLAGTFDCNPFQELEILDFSGSKFTTLSVYDNPKLAELNCSENGLTMLDLSNNVDLIKLNCSGNNLTDLDLYYNLHLGVLDCSNNNLSTLDLSRQKKLVSLYCSQNGLGALNLSDNVDLMALDCSENLLTALDLSKNEKIDFLSCSDNPFSANLNLTSNVVLKSLFSSNSGMNNLNVSSGQNLVSLYSPKNNLQSIDLADNTNLEYLYLSGNEISSIDVSKNIGLKVLDCSDNKLAELDLSANTEIYAVNFSSNEITEFTTDASLVSLICNDNMLKFSFLAPFTSLSSEDFIFSPQNLINGGEANAGTTIDLSNEYEFLGNITSYEWYNGTNSPITLLSKGNGKFLASMDYYGEILTCKMTNLTFPDLTVSYQVKVIDSITGITPPNIDEDIVIFPSPIEDVLNIEASDAIREVRIVDIAGRIVKQAQQEGKKYEISVSELPSGVYLLQITKDSGQRFVHKVKKK